MLAVELASRVELVGTGAGELQAGVARKEGRALASARQDDGAVNRVGELSADDGRGCHHYCYGTKHLREGVGHHLCVCGSNVCLSGVVRGIFAPCVLFLLCLRRGCFYSALDPLSLFVPGCATAIVWPCNTSAGVVELARWLEVGETELSVSLG